MPIYAYRCARCSHELDALQKISEPPLVDCPACGEAALAKQVTAAGFQLKGSGWYQTDFRQGSKPAAKEASKDAGTTGTTADTATAAPDSAATAAKNEKSTESPAPAASSSGCGSGCSCH